MSGRCAVHHPPPPFASGFPCSASAALQLASAARYPWSCEWSGVHNCSTISMASSSSGTANAASLPFRRASVYAVPIPACTI